MSRDDRDPLTNHDDAADGEERAAGGAPRTDGSPAAASLNREVQRGAAAADLEWATLLGLLARDCVSEAGRERVERLMPATSLSEARQRMQLSREALAAMEEGDPVIARAVPPIRAVVTRLDKGGTASAVELRGITSVLTAARQLRPYARTHRDTLPLLAAALWSEPTLDELLGELERCIDEDGLLRDDASAELRQARRRASGLRRALLDEIDRLAARYSDVLRDGQHVERDGRYALPVRCDAHRRVEGIVLGSSSSGATLYVEPRQVTDLGNRLTMAESEVEREQARVLAELSGRATRKAGDIATAYDACVEADVLAALSSFAERSHSIAVVPEQDGRLQLRAVRHPVLALRAEAVIANDVDVVSGKALVISGPNAGGKTVTLKCLGLIVWMARAGIPVPVGAETHIGWYDQVLTDFGDAQSIERSLSTFSAEVDNLRRIVETVDARSLVLLDEVAASTDPEEGSALAAATLEALIDRGAAVVATTHYERLKELAADGHRFVNASVGFDFDAMQPTFRLTSGLPGASSAILVAARHGLPTHIIERAKQLLPSDTIDRQQLLEDLEKERQSLSEARSMAEQEARRANALRQEMEEERRTARKQERRRLAAEAEELTVAVREARAKLRRIGSDLEAHSSKTSLRRAERAVDEIAKHVAIGSPMDRAVRAAPPGFRDEPIRAAELQPGTRVYVPRLGTVGEIEQGSHRNQVRVRVGGLSTQVRASELRRVDGQPPRTAPSNPKKGRRGGSGPTPNPPRTDEAPMRTSGNTCNLRGMRVDEALGELDSFLDGCLRCDESVGFVLHGHGTGALKRAVREHLAESSAVRQARPAELGEGGDAFTIFWLTS